MSHKFNPYKDSHHHEQHKHNTLPDYNTSRPLGDPKFKVVYHLNNDQITNINNFIIDNQVYCDGETVVARNYTLNHVSADGMTMFSFVGWAYTPSGYAIEVFPEQEMTINSGDIALYAQWAETPTVVITNNGGLYIKEEYLSQLRHLSIPEYYRGKRITRIVEPGFSRSRITSIVIPASITHIDSKTFDGWMGTSVTFAEAEITNKYPGLTLGANLFKDTPNLTSILLPYRLIHFEAKVFPAQNKFLSIFVRHRKEYMSLVTGCPSNTIESSLSDNDDDDEGYIRTIQWGYNE